MNILSLFDGMSCGYLALQKAEIPIDRYDAYEIDKYALQVSKHNFPDIIQHGDVFNADFSIHKDVDILMGGSPCTYWSIAQKNNRETEASGMGWELFSQYVRALHEVKPRFFVYENNKSMSEAIRRSISETFGFEPILINSALVSAQNRQRLYWVGRLNDDGTYTKVDIEQPEDRGILLKDILDSNYISLSDREMDYMVRDYQGRRWNFCQKPAEKDKSSCLVANVCKGVPYNVVAEPVNTTSDGKLQCLRATCYKDGIRNMVGNNVDKRTCVAEPVCVQEQVYGRKINDDGVYDRRFEARKDLKSGTLTQGNRQISIAEPVIECVSSRGVYRDTGSRSQKSEAGTEQRFEVRSGGKTNALTTVQKDNMVARQVGALPRPNGELSTSQGMRVYSPEAKSVTLKSGGGGMGGKTGLYAIRADNEAVPVYRVENGLIEIKDKKYPIKLKDGCYTIRKLTVNECKRLQTVPEWYDFSVISNTQAYKCLGNGWSVDVIVHLLEAILKENKKDGKQEQV